MDTKIVHPTNYDFYMCAHAGILVSLDKNNWRLFIFQKLHSSDLYYNQLHIMFPSIISQGTSRPAHYHVLLDEIGFSPDDLQNLIHSLSYV